MINVKTEKQKMEQEASSRAKDVVPCTGQVIRRAAYFDGGSEE